MNIYISNLSYGVNDADLNQLFGEYGVSQPKSSLIVKQAVQEDSVLWK